MNIHNLYRNIIKEIEKKPYACDKSSGFTLLTTFIYNILLSCFATNIIIMTSYSDSMSQIILLLSLSGLFCKEKYHRQQEQEASLMDTL